MKLPKLTESMDGQLRATVTIRYRLDLEDLAQYLWDGSPYTETDTEEERPDLTVAVIHERVTKSLKLRGTEFFIESDEYWSNGGQEWALSQVKRAYREDQ